MKYAKVSIVIATVISVLSTAALASQRHLHPHARDFYAKTSDEGDIAPTLAVQKETHGSDCFRSVTPVELTRGIRHWTGNC